MNSQKKRLAFYFLFIFLGFTIAYFFLREHVPTLQNSTSDAEKKDSLVTATLESNFIDLENNNDGYVTTEKAVSGKKSCKLSESMEFGVGNAKTVSEIPGYNTLKTIHVTFNAAFEKTDPEAVYVLSIDNSEGKNIFWDSRPIQFTGPDGWKEQSLQFTILPEFLNPDNKVVVYPWNPKKRTVFIDNITIDYIGTKTFSETTSNQSERSNLFYDFETVSDIASADNVKEGVAHSGKKACDLSGGKEFGPSVSKKLTLISDAPLKKISMSVWVYPLADNVNLVLTGSVVNAKNEAVFWEGESTENKPFPKNQWTKINASFGLPSEKFSPDDVLGIGVWNKGKTDVIVDDLEIVYGEGSERRGLPSTVDPVSIYEKRFVPVKNKPPFRTIWFEKQEIKNQNTVSLTPPLNKDLSNNFFPGDRYIVGDFYPDKNGLDEVLHIGYAYKGLYTYVPDKQQFTRLWDTPLVADSLWNGQNNYYAGDFNSDGLLDILLVNIHTNEWGILTFSGKKWTIKAQGKNPKKEWLAVKDQEGVFPGNYSGNKQVVLKFNKQWRFDLKMFDNDLILGAVDFKGYPADHNPKYYEFVKLLAGNFVSKGQTTLLVIMSNCRDRDFNGNTCNEYEDLSMLPNSVQLYSMSKEPNGLQLTQTSEKNK